MSLFSKGQAALRAFSQCKHRWSESGQDRDGEYKKLNFEFERFRLWAVSFGLFQRGHGSLDYRFRDAVHVAEYCGGLLQDLAECLSALSDVLQEFEAPVRRPEAEGITGDHSYSAEDVDDSYIAVLNDYEDEPVTTSFLSTVTDCNDRLMRVGTRIRNPSTRLGLSQALNFSSRDSETGVDLYDMFLVEDKHHIAEIFASLRGGKHEGKYAYLKDRLTKANNLRRRQFGYWVYHKEMLDQRGSIDAALELLRNDEAGATRAYAQVNDRENTDRGVAPSGTTATRLDPSRSAFLDSLDAQSIQSYISIPLRSDSDELDESLYPERPDIISNSGDVVKEFECPFCHIICSAKMLQTNERWRSHVRKDLRPYLCTFMDCKENVQIYDHFEDWVTHNNAHHPFLDDEKGRECPFCIKVIGPAGTWYDHVAQDLIRVALFTIPRGPYDERESNVNSKLAQSSGHSIATTLMPGQSHAPSIKADDPAPFDPALSIKGPASGAANAELLDPRYKTRDPRRWGSFFVVGRVFAILKHVDSSRANDAASDAKWVTQQGKLKIFTHVRRFAVVKEGHGFCWGIPINTYRGQGVKKYGLNAEQIQAHAIIYDSESSPAALPGEPTLEKRPIAVDRVEDVDPLNSASRINFAEVTTIQHNVRAMAIGRIRPSSLAHFQSYWRVELLR